MTFTVESLREQLDRFPPDTHFAVAFSGGLDSTVLLHATHAALRQRESGSLRAIHIHHGLSPNADAWALHCQERCTALGIALQVERVQVPVQSGASVESVARERRYEAFEALLGSEEVLLMAHHLDDEAETFLLRTLRGAGPRGLAAIPAMRPLGRGILFRPLLEQRREALESWAFTLGLTWIIDESNHSLRFDRNYLRHAVLPLLEERWPGYRESWWRSCALAGEADELNEVLAELDLARVKTASATVLDQSALQQLSPARQRNVLRHWLQQAGAPDPGWNVLTHIVDDMLTAGPDAHPEVRWREASLSVVVRRHKGGLYLQKAVQSVPVTSSYSWHPHDTLHLPSNGCVYALAVQGHGLRLPDKVRVTLRYRQGGETCRLTGRRTRSLKKILQDADIPQWLRERIPLLHVDDTLVCVPGIGVCDGWQAGPGEPGWKVIWIPPDLDPQA
jgi:tRNA(Ile)-lysidine synthase